MQRHQLMRKPFVFTFAVLILSFIAIPAAAWNIHPLLLHPMMAGMPEVSAAEPVAVHSLETFLLKNEKGLADVLAREEEWSKTNLEWYSPRPDHLAFKATGNSADVRQRFYHAIRINPHSKNTLYLQLLPSADPQGRSSISVKETTFLNDTEYNLSSHFLLEECYEIPLANRQQRYGIQYNVRF